MSDAPPPHSVTIPLIYFQKLLDIAYGKRPLLSEPAPQAVTLPPPPATGKLDEPHELVMKKQTAWKPVDPARFREAPTPPAAPVLQSPGAPAPSPEPTHGS